MKEIGEGVAILLRKDPPYAAFARDVDVEGYLEGACKEILQRFGAPRTPSAASWRVSGLPRPSRRHHQSFSKRFADRVDKPIHAYQSEKGTIPTAASQSIFSLYQLIANGSFIDKVQSGQQAAVRTQ